MGVIPRLEKRIGAVEVFDEDDAHHGKPHERVQGDDEPFLVDGAAKRPPERARRVSSRRTRRSQTIRNPRRKRARRGARKKHRGPRRGDADIRQNRRDQGVCRHGDDRRAAQGHARAGPKRLEKEKPGHVEKHARKSQSDEKHRPHIRNDPSLFRRRPDAPGAHAVPSRLHPTCRLTPLPPPGRRVRAARPFSPTEAKRRRWRRCRPQACRAGQARSATAGNSQ